MAKRPKTSTTRKAKETSAAAPVPRTVRAYLAGRLAIEVDGQMVEQDEFVGQQGRLAFAFLMCERSRPVSRTELVDVLWPNDPPPAADAALNAVISKLRGVFTRLGFSAKVLTSSSGCYELRLPSHTWVDIEAAAEAIHDAEDALRQGDGARAYGPSAVAHHIARRPFLAGDEGQRAELRRQKMRNLLLRALECRAEVYLWNTEYALAADAASEMIALEPFRETGHQLLMRAHAGAGNVAEALLAYERCRKLIAEELGVGVSERTKAVHWAVVRGG